MATRTFRASAGNFNWNVAGNWLEGVVPTNADDVVFDSLSYPQCTVNAIASMLTFNSANYTGTIAMNNNFNISGNSCIWGSGLTITTTNSATRLVYGANCTVTNNNVFIPITLRSLSITLTLNDDMSVQHCSSTIGIISNNSTMRYLKVAGNVNNVGLGGHISSVAATPACLQMNGTGTYTSGGYVCTAPFEINTSGTITFDATNPAVYGALSLPNYSFNWKYTSGTIIQNNVIFRFLGTTNTFKISLGSLTLTNLVLDGLVELLGNASVTNCYTATNTYTNHTISGAYTLTCDNLLINQYGGSTYRTVTINTATTVRVNLSISSLAGSVSSIASSSSTIKAVLTVSGTCNLNRCAFTRIDASAGIHLYTYGAAVTECFNVAISSQNIII